MLSENAEVVRRFWDVLSVRRDFDAAVDFVHPDAEFDWSDSRAPYRGVYRGVAEGKLFWTTWLEAWEVWNPQITEAIDVDPETVVVVTVVEGRGRGSGVVVRAEGASVWQVRDGKIAYAKLFQSKADALAAVTPRAT